MLIPALRTRGRIHHYATTLGYLGEQQFGLFSSIWRPAVTWTRLQDFLEHLLSEMCLPRTRIMLSFITLQWVPIQNICG